MENTLDYAYRSLRSGLQLGLCCAAVGWLNQILQISQSVYLTPCSLFSLGTVLGTCFAAYLDTLQVELAGRGVLVTGCDSGFGYDIALRLHGMGAVVFAGCLFSEGQGAKSLKNRNLKNFHVIQLNVTSDEEVQKAVEYIKQNSPEKGLWGILNNAGWSTFGFVEWVPIETCKYIMDVNVWGTVRVIQACLPLLRASKGRIVNMSSGLGCNSAPNRSSYGITKHGVEALSDCLRYEMKRWGVTVAMIEPGNFVNATGIFTPEKIREQAQVLWSKIPENVQKDYTKTFFDSVINSMIYYSTKGTTDKNGVLNAMRDALVHRYPHPRYQPMEPYFKVRTWINIHLPEWIYEYLYV